MTNNKVQKGADLRDIIEMMQIPELNEFFKLSVEAFKSGAHKSRIDEHSRQVHNHYQRLFEEPARVEKSAGNKMYPPLYWFDFFMLFDNFWEIIGWESTSQGHSSAYNVLPKDVFERLTEELVDPRKVHSRTIYSRFLEKTVDLEFVRTSPYQIVGTVRESLEAGVCNVEKTDRIRNKQEEWRFFEKAHRVVEDYHQKFPEASSSFIKWYLHNVAPILKAASAVNHGETPALPFKVYFNKLEDGEMPSPQLPRKEYRIDPKTGKRTVTVVVPEKMVIKTTEIHLVPTREVRLAPGETAETVGDPEVRAILEDPDTVIMVDGKELEVEESYVEDNDYLT